MNGERMSAARQRELDFAGGKREHAERRVHERISASGRPIERLNGSGRGCAPGRFQPGSITREKTRALPGGGRWRSGTTTPMRG